MKTHASGSQFKCVKGASFDGRMAGAGGYLLGREDSVVRQSQRYTLGISRCQGFSFLFGFQGIGCHYRCDIAPDHGVIALYQIMDGIPLYLHHVCLGSAPPGEIQILWQSGSIRVKLDGFCVLNLIANGPVVGHWGFASLGTPFEVPRLTTTPAPVARFEWICLGDGFSNARWRNRHFPSWPELLWGSGESCLNACVGAGNSRRVLEVIGFLGETTLNGANVIVATGSDDLIEGEDFDNYAGRLERILAELRNAGAAKVHLCTLPPRVSDLANTTAWSAGIQQFATTSGIPVLDFHAWILPEIASCMVRGEYPGARAQELITAHASETLGLGPVPPHPCTFEPQRPAGALLTIARKAERWLGRYTLDFPGLVR